MSLRDSKDIDVYRDMRDGEWASKHKLAIIVGIAIASLIISLAVYRAFLGSPDDTDFKRMLFRIGKTIAGADKIDVGEVALISNFSYLAYDVKFYRNKALIANFSEVSIAMYPLTAIVGDVYTQAELKFRKGGILRVYAHLPPLQLRNLSTVNFSSMEVNAKDIPFQALTGALIRHNPNNPVRVKTGTLSGRISFDDRKEIKTRTGFMHLSVKNLSLDVKCKHPYVQWKGCNVRNVRLDPFSIYTKISKGRMKLVDPVLLRIFLRRETAKVNGSAFLKYPPSLRIGFSSPSQSPLTAVLRGLFGCKPKRSANYRLSGNLGRLKCR